MFRIQLLGPVELHTDDHHSSLGSPKERLTFAALAWDANRLVSAEVLARRIWGDDLPRKPHQALYAYISRIRRTLRELGTASPELSGHSRAYRLETPGDTVDLRVYTHLVEEAQAATEAGDSDHALHLLGEAAQLWHGEPLTGLQGVWAEEVRSFVANSSLTAALLRARHGLWRGRYSEAAAELSSLAPHHPLDETVVEYLVLALYGCGRTAEATRLLQRTRRRLVEETGTDPGQRLQHIQQGILTRTPITSLLPHRTREPAAQVQNPAPDNLPRDTHWVGRAAELNHIIDPLLQSASPSTPPPMTVIDGMAGSGKSALAVHVGHLMRDQFPDGRIFLDLRGHSPVQQPLPPADALTDLLRLIGPPATALPQDRTALPQDLDALTALWRSTMRTRRAIVILDDAVSPEQVAPLLPGASPALVLITSRRRLTGLPGVQPLSLDALPPDDAAALFESRVSAHRTLSTDQTARIVRLCSYLPLAIEITASRFLSRPSWSAEDLTRRLTRKPRRLPEIRDGHRRMAQAFDLSYRALTDVQQRAFRRLGQHFGPEFSLPAAEALTDLPPDITENVVEDLLTSHLLQEPAPHRYRLHDLVREFSLLAPGDTTDDHTAAARRLIDHYLYAADRADRLAYPHRARITLDPANNRSSADSAFVDQDDHPRTWFVTEGPSLLATLEYAHQHAPRQTAALLTHVLAGFLDNEGYLRTARLHLEHAVTVWRQSENRLELTCALIDLCTVCAHIGDYRAAITAAEEAVDQSRSIGKTQLQAESLHQLATAHWHTGRYQQALPHQQQALLLRKQHPDALQLARSLNALGMTLLHLDREESIERFRESLTLFRAAGDLRGEYLALNNLAENYKRVGDLEQAHLSYRQAMQISRDHGSDYERTLIQMNLADALRRVGELDEARDLFQDSLPVLRSADDNRSECIALIGLGRTLHTQGHPAEALSRHLAALDLASRIEAATEQAQALREMGRAEYETGSVDAALEHLQASLALTRRLQDPAELSESLVALAELQNHRGLHDQAAQLHREARVIIGTSHREGSHPDQ